MNAVLLVLIGLFITVQASANDKPPRKEAICRACHGKFGDIPAANNYPKLKGQNKEYLISAMEAYQKGERKGTMASMMAVQARMLTKEEIQALANYYSQLK